MQDNRNHDRIYFMKTNSALRGRRKRRTGHPKIDTRLLHGGEIEDGDYGSVVSPIYKATTYRLNERVYALIKKSSGTKDPEAGISDRELKELRYRIFYTRDSNPNVAAIQKKMAAIEGCDDSVAASSGMGAVASTLLSLVKGKRYIVSTPHLYGASFSFIFGELREMFGIRHLLLEDFLSGKWERRIKSEQIAAVFVESYSNPFLRIAPLDEIRETRDASCPEVPIVVDNTFLTPANIRLFSVLDPERDIILYSATKYLAGHSDVIAGIACGPLPKINAVWRKMVLYGCCLDAEAAYHFEKGLKTLHLRMERHNTNMSSVVDYLMSVSRKYGIELFHPLNGKERIPDFARVFVESRKLGGMVTFNIRRKNEEDGIRFMKVLHRAGVIKHATSLGGVESLISMPYNVSHAAWAQQEMLGLKNYHCLLRLSVGIEDAEDIIKSLDTAFKTVTK